CVAVVTRACVVAVSGAAVAVAGAAAPLARLFADEQAGVLAAALPAYAPGVVAFGVTALLSRALYAVHRGRLAATAQVAGWAVAAGASAAAVALCPPEQTVAALGAGTSLGLGTGAVRGGPRSARAAAPPRRAGWGRRWATDAGRARPRCCPPTPRWPPRSRRCSAGPSRCWATGRRWPRSTPPRCARC